MLNRFAVPTLISISLLSSMNTYPGGDDVSEEEEQGWYVVQPQLDRKYIEMAFWNAVDTGNLKEVKEIVTRYNIPRTIQQDTSHCLHTLLGKTPVHRVLPVSKGQWMMCKNKDLHKDILTTLLDLGFTTDEISDGNETTLLQMTQQENELLLRPLIESENHRIEQDSRYKRGAINISNREGKTPLHIASEQLFHPCNRIAKCTSIEKRKLGVLQLLVAHKGLKILRDNEGKTPFEAACEKLPENRFQISCELKGFKEDMIHELRTAEQEGVGSLSHKVDDLLKRLKELPDNC